MRKKFGLDCVKITGLIALSTGSLFAHAEGSVLEEIMVTAQKRSENIQEVPISITAFGADFIKDAGLTGFQELQFFVPNMVSESAGDARAGVMRIRGVGTAQTNPGMDSSVGVFVDGVYMGRQGMGMNDLMAIERIEVLRGPQGTLYGKNTPAGAINVITKNPTQEAEGELQISAGNYGFLDTRAYFSGGMTDNLSGSVALTRTERDGWTKHLQTGKYTDDLDRYSVRAKLHYSVDDLDVVLAADFYNDESSCCGNLFFDAGPLGEDTVPAGSPGSRTTNTNFENENAEENSGVALTVIKTMGDWELTSITAYREWDVFSRNDADSTPLEFFKDFSIALQQSQFSQEFRLATEDEQGNGYLFGFFYFDQDMQDDEFVDLLWGPIVNDMALNTESYALFGTYNHQFSDKLKMSLGLRYTSEEKSIDLYQESQVAFIVPSLAARDSRSSNDLSGTVNVSYFSSEDLMWFATLGRGFKSGGFDATRISSLDFFEFDDETSTSFEVGMKSTLMDGRMRLNATAFAMEFDDYQASSFNGTSYTTRNAATLDVKGVEFDLQALLTEELSVFVSVGLLDAVFDKFENGPCMVGVSPAPCDQSGTDLNHAPDFSGSLVVQYEKPIADTSMALKARIEYSYRDDFFTAQDHDPRSVVDAYGLVNVRVGIDSDSGWAITAWGKNVTDEEYGTLIFDNPIVGAGAFVGFLGAPRTYGVDVSYQF